MAATTRTDKPPRMEFPIPFNCVDLFADRQVEVEPHVVSYLARRIERSVATAIDVVDRLDRAALEEKSRITRALAARVVSALDEGQGALPFP